MPNTVRIGDLFVGVCTCHKVPIGMSGLLVKGSNNVSAEKIPVSGIGDQGVGFCGHSTILVEGSSTVSRNKIKASNVGDKVSGCIKGVMVKGASTVKHGD